MVIGRYALFDELAAGGMATVHLGRLLGPVGFGRTVAVKRLHAHFLKDEEFITMFMDEARIVSRIAHPNVVPMVDVVQNDEGLFLVMEYVHGESLSRLLRTTRKTGEKIPPRIVSAVMSAMLHGLHAAHETKGANGELLGVVHRDVSPQNVIVGADGVPRVLDFGIAKAAGRVQVTREGQIKGKLSYMAPEQIRGSVDRRSDVFAASVVLWEMLAGRRFHEGAKDVDIVTRVMRGEFVAPSTFDPSITPELDAIVMRGLAFDPDQRFTTAREMAAALHAEIGSASPTEVGAWVERLGKDVLEARANLVSAMELAANHLVPSDAQHLDSAAALMALEQAAHAANGAVPVVVDDLPPLPQGDVPSSSSVFAHTQSTAQAAPTPPRRGRATAALVLVLSVLLALLGLGLGSLALYKRTMVADIAKPRAPTRTPSAPIDTADPLPTIAPSSIAAPSSSPTPPVEAQRRRVPIVRGGAAPRPGPAPLPALAVEKKNCDPPYTIDDVGHRHYKPECD